MSRSEIQDNGCWLWKMQLTKDGYGRVRHGPRSWVAHRLSYVTFVGPIPDGMALDHLCRNRRCINPAHLEPVTPAENTRRAAQLITHCPQGHAYTLENTLTVPSRPGTRYCRACHNERSLRRYYAQGETPADRTALSSWGKSRKACVEDALEARQLEAA